MILGEGWGHTEGGDRYVHYPKKVDLLQVDLL